MKISRIIQKIQAALNCNQNPRQVNDQQFSFDHREKELELKLFQKIQKVMATMGLTPNQQQNNHRLFNSIQIFYIVKYSVNTITLGAYVLLKADGIEQYMDLIFNLTVVGGIAMAFVSIIFKSDKLFNMIKVIEVELSFRSNNNPKSRAIHEEANQLIEKLSKIIYFAAMNLGVPGFVLPKAIISYCLYYTTDAGSDAFELPFPSCYPFNWKNPIGYFFAVAWQYATVFILLRFLACLPPLALAFYLLCVSLTKDWKGDLRTLDKMTKTKQSETDIFKQLTEFVRSHSNIKQLINVFVDVFEVCVFADVLCCTITLCVVMMMIQVEIISKDIVDPIVILESIVYGVWVFGLVFLSSEIGQRATNSFEEVIDRIDQLNWYLFPMKVQRLLPTLMINAQELPVFKCFGLVDGSREQFKKVVNAVYKSFNVLREIYK